MTVSLKEDGVEVNEVWGSDLEVTISPSYPEPSATQDLNILTVVSSVTDAEIETPLHWTKIIEGLATYDNTSEEFHVAIFHRKGSYTGPQEVTLSRLGDAGDGTIRASIDLYERALGEYWYIFGYSSEYIYYDEELNEYTGTGLFVTLDDLVITISVVFNESLTAPGFEVTVTGLDDFDAITLTSQDGSGTLADQVVRGADEEPVSSESFFVTDYEFQNFDSVIYAADLYLDGVLQDTIYSDEQVEVPREFYVDNGYYPHINSWLQGVEIPELSMPIYIEAMSTRTRKGRLLNVSNVLGNKYPVVTTDVLSAREGSFTFSVDLGGDISNSGPRDVDLILDNGDTLLLRHLDGIELCEDPTYLVITNITRDRKGVYTNSVMMYEVEYIEVERPAPIIRVDTDSWQTVSDNNADWAAVRNTHTNWLQVLINP